MSKFKAGQKLKAIRDTFCRHAGDLVFVDGSPHPHHPEDGFLIAGTDGYFGGRDEDYEPAEPEKLSPVEWLKRDISTTKFEGERGEVELATLRRILREAHGIASWPRVTTQFEWVFKPVEGKGEPT